MFLPFFVKDFDNRSDLPQLVERLGNGGGSIIAYQQVYSAILFTITRTVFEAVPNGRSAVLVGVKHTMVSLVLGPWSWFGPFATLRAVLTNLSGGSNVTDLLNANAGADPLPSERLREDAERKETAVQYAFAAILFAILGIPIWKLVLPVYDSATP